MSEKQSIILACILAFTLCYIATQFSTCVAHESEMWRQRAEYTRAEQGRRQ